MNIAVVEIGSTTINQEIVQEFNDVNLAPIGMSKRNGISYLLLRIDDESITGSDILNMAPVNIDNVEFITGREKDELIQTYVTHGQVTVSVSQ